MLSINFLLSCAFGFLKGTKIMVVRYVNVMDKYFCQ